MSHGIAATSGGVESRIVEFIKQFYGSSGDIQVKIVNLPVSLQEKMKVAGISFSRVPDHNGDGQCLVDIMDQSGRTRSVYVAVKILSKRKLFVLKDDARPATYFSK
jgi:hypothetical protein